ncbi:RING finger protein 222 [Diretmus argenteus]
MAFYKQESQDEAQGPECPVCYESLSGIERTLSCGHVFCHDCLVKTLVSVNGDGTIRDTIICPVCRHLTFIKKRKDAVVSLAAVKDADEQQTLEVPLPPPPGDPVRLQSARRASVDSLHGTGRDAWIVRCFRGISERIRRQRLVSPCHNASQIFIISAQGRPMAEEDALSAVVTVVQPLSGHRRRRRICTTSHWLLFLLSAFTILALVAATLPWILLA